MAKKDNKNRNKRFMLPGMTLLEIMVVVIVISVLATLAVPRFYIFVERMRAKEAEQILLAVLAAMNRYEIENGTLPTQVSDLDIDLRAADNFDISSLTLHTGDLCDTDTRSSIKRVNQSGQEIYCLSIHEKGGFHCYALPNDICHRLGYSTLGQH